MKLEKLKLCLVPPECDCGYAYDGIVECEKDCTSRLVYIPGNVEHIINHFPAFVALLEAAIAVVDVTTSDDVRYMNEKKLKKAIEAVESV